LGKIAASKISHHHSLAATVVKDSKSILISSTAYKQIAAYLPLSSTITLSRNLSPMSKSHSSLILITAMILFSIGAVTAQQLTAMKTTISATGQSYFKAGNYALSQTIAQPSLVGGFQSGSLHLLQGFQHPHRSQSQEVERKFDVFPNPSRGHITIAWHGHIQNENVEVTLFDLAGRKIRRDTVPKSTKQIFLDYSDVTSGPYYLLVEGQISGRAYASLLIL
jgi:hypothetical protein